MHNSDRTMTPTKGLIIRPAPLEKILSGQKTWEMRSRATKVRGPIGLIQKGSGKVFGIATLVSSVGPLTDDEMVKHHEKHRIESARLHEGEIAKWRVAWVLEQVKRLATPVPYVQKSGPVVFVNLDDAAIARLSDFA